jgi:hypothetical protein
MAYQHREVVLTIAFYLCNRSSTVAVALLSQPFQEHLGEVHVAFLIRPICTLVGMPGLSNPFFQVSKDPLTAENAASFYPIKIASGFDVPQPCVIKYFNHRRHLITTTFNRSNAIWIQ